MSKFTDRINTTHVYVPACKTNIRKTIERERRRLEALKEENRVQAEALAASTAAKVRVLK